MPLRVIAGSAKGRRLKLVPGDTTRPIMDRVKEALFSILGRDIVDSTFLDLFAGTGSVVADAAGRAVVAGRAVAAGFLAAGRAAGAFGATAGSAASCGFCVSTAGVSSPSRADVWRVTSPIVTATRHEAASTTTRPRRVIIGFPDPQRGFEPVSFTGITSSLN